MISELEEYMGYLFRLSNQPNAKSTYITQLDKAHTLLAAIAIQRERRLGEILLEEEGDHGFTLAVTEELIYDTLLREVPSAAKSYRQALIDLTDKGRLSYRGPANELREALREILDHLAPNEDVIRMEGFELEPNTTSPTRRQKVRFILRSREQTGEITRAISELTAIIEDRVEIITTITFGMINAAAHTETEREQVLRIKHLVDIVLSEVLSLPVT